MRKRLDLEGFVPYNVSGFWKWNRMLPTLIAILQVLCALGVVILLAIQTSKAEQGGVMGLGAAGGRGASDVDMLVGPERILKPLTKWIAVGFLFLSLLRAIPRTDLSIVHFGVVVLIYVVSMVYGGVIWNAITGTRR